MYLLCTIIKNYDHVYILLITHVLFWDRNTLYCLDLKEEKHSPLRHMSSTCSLPKVPHISARDRSGLQAGHLNAHTFFQTPKPHCRKEHRLRFQSVLFQKKTLSEGRQMFLYMWQRTTCTLMPSQMCATDVMSSQMCKGHSVHWG